MRIVLFVLNTLADWEIAYLTAEIHSKRFFSDRSAACDIVRVGNTMNPITTMGGMTIAPDMTVDDLQLKDDDILVLPGAETWMEAEQDRILVIAKDRIAADMPVAAICGATLGLARVGALDSKWHTSNDMDYLCYFTQQYRGKEKYLKQLAVCDQNLITASGFAPVAFTHEIMKLTRMYRPATLDAWLHLQTTNDPVYFYALMQSLQ